MLLWVPVFRYLSEFWLVVVALRSYFDSFRQFLDG